MPKKVQWNHSFVRPGVRPTGPGWEACDINPVVLDIPDFEEHTAHIQIFSREMGLALLAQLIDKLPALHYQRAVRGMLRAAIPELTTRWNAQFYEEHRREKALAALRKETERVQGTFGNLGITIEIMEIPTSEQPPKALLTLEYAGFDKYRFVFSDATVSKCFGCARCGDRLMHELENTGVIVTDDVHDRLLVEMTAEGMQFDCRNPNPDNRDPKRNAAQLASELREARRMDEAANWPSLIFVDDFIDIVGFSGPQRRFRPRPNDRNNLRDDPED